MYNKKSKSWLKHIDFLLVDIVALELAYALAYYLRIGKTDMYSQELYATMAWIIAFLDVLVVAMFGTFKNVLKRGYFLEIIGTFKHCGLVIVLSGVYLFLAKTADNYSRGVFVLTFALYCVIGYIVRIIYKKILSKTIANKKNSSIYIAATKDMAEDTIANVKLYTDISSSFIAGITILDKDMKGQKISGVEVKANADDITDYICREWVDEVFISVPDDYTYPEKLINNCEEMGVTVHYKIKHCENMVGQKPIIEKMGNYTVLTTSTMYATTPQLFVKRIADIVGAIVGLIFTAILCIFVVPAICIQSPGNPFFSQERIGKNGKRFRMYKFRSMYKDAEERKKELMAKNNVKDGMMFKMDFDPRIIGNKELPDGTKKTGLGAFIRKTSIDEFPQFLNVLKGDMSLVGTRPPTPDEWDKYKLHHRSRLAVKPGITGMWQVSGRSEITDFEEVVRLDREYVNNWSFALDVKILLLTVWAVLAHKGSK